MPGLGANEATFKAWQTEWQAKRDMSEAYSWMPRINVFVQVTDGFAVCVANIEIKVNAKIKAGYYEIASTKHTVSAPAVELWSEGYSMRAKHQNFPKAMTDLVIQGMKELVVDWAAAQKD